MTRTAATHATESWLEIIPAIPLARGVPVRFTAVGAATFSNFPSTGTLVSAPAWPPDGLWFIVGATARGIVQATDASERRHLRVDLDDPQGFAYALRWLAQHGDPQVTGKHDDLIEAATDAFLYTGVTDADRLALARALAEVV